MKISWRARALSVLVVSLEALAFIYICGVWRAEENHRFSDRQPTHYERY